ncbi:MAG: TIGR02300 family protein [Proteobacteria bacterium]|nr:TIGR02300 family protein [Pseudomonadota bacterium]
MVKPELGTKRTCVSCGTRFYDLGKATPACPKCGTEQPPEQPRLKRGGNQIEERRLKKPVAPVRAEEPDPEVGEVEDVVEDDDVLDETPDLDDDDDPIEGEIEVEKDVDERDQ